MVETATACFWYVLFEIEAFVNVIVIIDQYLYKLLLI